MKCNKCGAKVVRFPIKDEEGKLILKNLFKMDLMSMVWIIVIILLVTSYKADTETCREIMTRPLTFCEESNACRIIEQREKGLIDIMDIPEINNTKW